MSVLIIDNFGSPDSHGFLLEKVTRRDKTMDYGKIMELIIALSARIKQDFSDKKITVNELLGEVKLAVNELGLGDIVVLDLSKREKVSQ